MTAQALVEAVRFGLGPRPGELAAAGGPAALKAQLRGPATVPVPPGVPATTEIVTGIVRATRRGREPDVVAYLKAEAKRIYLAEMKARAQRAVETDRPFRERLVHFWSNHFTVSASKPVIVALTGAFEREAIAPHVTGRFLDLLRAATRHPAMLLYLDQATSVGPDSVAGQRRGKGLNENLARELLELHTLGVDGGYGQDDVGALARILTGWTVAREAGGPAAFFEPRLHQPGSKRLLGTAIADAGVGEGDQALALLARHPATARHLATKLARHFVADEPPEEAVDRIAAVFRATDGDLGAVSAALVDLDAAWSAPLTKVKAPNDYVLSILRLIGFAPEGEVVVGALRLLGQQPFTAPSPQGWSDRARDWISPDAVMRRIELAQKIGARLGPLADGETLLRESLGDAAGPALREAVARAGDRTTAVTLLLASPDFQRR